MSDKDRISGRPVLAGRDVDGVMVSLPFAWSDAPLAGGKGKLGLAQLVNGSSMLPAMAHVVSLVLVGLALVLTVAGVATTGVPFLGTVLSFAAPAAALGAVVAGGVSMSRARRAGEPNTLGLVGVIGGALTALPAMVVAVSCGLCNACMSAASMRDDGRPSSGSPAGDPTAPSLGPLLEDSTDAEPLEWRSLPVGETVTGRLTAADEREVPHPFGGTVRVPYKGFVIETEKGTSYTVEIGEGAKFIGDGSLVDGDPRGRGPMGALRLGEVIYVQLQPSADRTLLVFRAERGGAYGLMLRSGTIKPSGGVTGRVHGDYRIRVTEGVPEAHRDEVEKQLRLLSGSGP